MTVPELMEWLAWYGSGERWYGEAFLLAGVGNILGSKRPLKPDDFLSPRRRPRQTQAQIAAALKAHVATYQAAQAQKAKR